MFGLGWAEIAVIVVILVLLFGGKKIPELVKGITDAVKEFRNTLGNDK